MSPAVFHEDFTTECALKTSDDVKDSQVAGPQQSLGYLVTAGPAGDLRDAIQVKDAGLIFLVFPAPQQSWRRAGFSPQSQHPEGRAGRQHLLF